MRTFHSYKLEAIIIRRRNFGEKDRILTLFSREEGKTDVISKGCRRPGSRLCSFSDIGLIATLHLHKAKFLPIVGEINPIFIPEGAHGKFEKTQKLSFAFKIIDRLFHEGEPHEKTFVVLCKALRGIADGQFQLIFLVFLAKVIEDLGLKPELFHCVICNKNFSGRDSLVFSQKGGVAHKGCCEDDSASISSQEIKLMRLIFDVPFEKISKAKVPDNIFEKVYGIVKSYIEWHFGEILPSKIL